MLCLSVCFFFLRGNFSEFWPTQSGKAWCSFITVVSFFVHDHSSALLSVLFALVVFTQAGAKQVSDQTFGLPVSRPIFPLGDFSPAVR